MKKKNSVIITSAIIGLSLVTSAFPVMATTPVATQAAIPVVTSAATITDPEQAIQLIEQNFLGTNKNGTAFIKDGASKYIKAETLEQIRQGMDRINKQIDSGILIKDTKGKIIKKVSSAGAESTVSPMNTINPALGTYTFYWYGFDFTMNAANSMLFSLDLADKAYTLSSGGSVGSLFNGGVAFVASGMSSLIGRWSTEAAKGSNSGRGSVAKFYGDPSWAQLYSVVAL